MRWISVCCLFAAGGVLAWTGVSSSVAGPAAAAAVGAVRPSRPQVSVPPPPAATGCYQFAHDRWRLVDCASPAYLRRHLRHLELEDGIQSAALMLGPGPGVAAAPFVYGQIGLEFTQVGTEKDSAVGKNAFSIQDNTTFTGSNGQDDGVQFADQSRPGGPDAVCVWNVDITKQIYTPICVLAPVLHRGVLASDYPVIEGDVTAKGKLETLAILPWSSGVVWSVVTPDKYGLAGRWTNISGSILGWGSSSHASFSSADVFTELGGSNCRGDEGLMNTGATCGGLPQLKTYASTYYSGATGETNNLTPVIGVAPKHLPKLLIPGNPNVASIQYVSTTTGKCPGKTKPPSCT
jgi:hypothetical protein